MSNKNVKLYHVEKVNGRQTLYFMMYNCKVDGSKVKPVLIIDRVGAAAYLKRMGLVYGGLDRLHRHPVVLSISCLVERVLSGFCGDAIISSWLQIKN